jgi:hypothetical protein
LISADFEVAAMGIIFVLMILVSCRSLAQTSPSIAMSDLHVDGIYATRTGDPTLYCLLGGDACIDRLPANAWNRDALIEPWLAAHPDAKAVPLSYRRWQMGLGSPAPREYLWVEDRGQSLNVTLVREGRYAASAMTDMLEAQQRMLASFPAAARGVVEEQLTHIPEEDRARRLVADADYLAKRRLLSDAERDAKSHQRGIWSEEGFPGRSPPGQLLDPAVSRTTRII